MRTTDPTGPAAEHREIDLLRRFHRDGDFHARAEFIERTMPIVHHVARRYTDRGEAYDDLVQAGAIGLVKAVDRFDVDRGVRFSTFAIPNIAGEIRRHFRDRGWSVRIPREMQERDALIARVSEKLVAELQRTPTVAEVAQAAGLSTAEVLETLEAARNYSAVSLDAPIDEDRTEMDGLGATETGYAEVEQRFELVEGMQGLQERERQIVALRFYEGLTQSEIAERLGISQMHVSRLLRQSLDAMRARIEDTACSTISATS